MDIGEIREGTILLVDKPHTWTSFDVVKKLKFALNVKKIGHAGTLDPLATGLLLIGTGKCTKQLNELQGMDKEYEGIIEIGKTTPSFDLETTFDSETDPSGISPLEVEQAAKALTGPMEQIPPLFSAIRVKGERAYKIARRAEDVQMEPRSVHIKIFEVETPHLPEIRFRIVCSKGTYIRSIARDIGTHLGVGAYLKALRRTKIGSYNITDAWNLEQLVTKFKQHEPD